MDAGPDWKYVAIAAWGVLVLAFGWIARMLHTEQKQHADRIGKIESTYVNRDELDKDLAQMRVETLRMHQENQNFLLRIDEKLERGSNTRHDIRDSLNAMQLMLSAALEKQGKDPNGRR